MQITKIQAQNLLKLWDTAIASAAQAHWAENGGTIAEYEEAFEEACWEWCIEEAHMNDALEMREDGLV